MSKAFGHDFVIVSDVRQMLPANKFLGGPWVHLATVTRGLKEYVAFQKLNSIDVYIEEVDPTDPNLFKQIVDDTEYSDLYYFLLTRGCLAIAGKDLELKGGQEGIPGLLSNAQS